LKLVNEEFKKGKNRKEILAFIWVPAPVSGIKADVLEAFELARELRQIIQSPMIKIEDWLTKIQPGYDNHLKSRTLNDFFSKSEVKRISELVKKTKESKSETNYPPVCPFNLNERDTIYQTLKKLDLMNKSENSVKVIFYPVYLSKNDQLLELDYYEAVAGCDMGIYPSTYEPYGLTPLEALALGVPAVTTDLSGFGLLVNEQLSEENNGIFVLNRKGRTNEEAAIDLAKIIIKHSQLSNEEVKNARITAREISELYSWRNIIKQYRTSYDEAVKRIHKN
ncbi:MAG: glycosyltransferase, partial [Candidatus Heimdallarchaeota archaeon]|nr:glycosyltransferase [Candidatus Heimdallarchaeota archaeon]